MKFISKTHVEFIFSTYQKSIQVYGENNLPKIDSAEELEQLDILSLLRIWDCCLIYIIAKTPDLDYCGWSKLDCIGFISCQLHNILEETLNNKTE